MRKSWIVVAGIILSIGMSQVCKAEETTAESESTTQEIEESIWHWQEDSDGWKYVDDNGQYKKNCWENIKGYWYYFDYEGYIATDWTSIKGYDYCFKETGELQVGWCYNDEEEKWYYYKPDDGSLTKGWYHAADGSWYWFSTRGQMADSGYKHISGKRYFFFDNGQLAANQYVGLSYMDENGWKDKRFDIVIQGKHKKKEISSETKDAFTEALKNIPREWIKKFNAQGWKILYYPNKAYYSAPLTDDGTYFICHKLDTNYKKIKIYDPKDLTAAFGEYIGYASGAYKREVKNEEIIKILNYKNSIEEVVYIPDYFSDDTKFYFGKLVETYLEDSSSCKDLEEAEPEVTIALKKILYQKDT